MALAWKAKLVGLAPRARGYLARTHAKTMHARRRGDQSQFFWGGAEIEPELDESGLENLGRLGRALLDRAMADYASIDDVEEVTSVDDHEAFHDLRKRVRSIVKLVDYFPELLQAGADEPLTMAPALVDRYGSLNDRILAYDMAKESEKRRLADSLEDEWKDLRTWQRKQHLDERLEELKKRIRKNGQPPGARS